MKKYPVIKIPDGLIDPKLELQKPIEPKEPIPPTKPKESWAFSSFFVFLVAFVLMALIATGTGGSVLGAIFGIITFFSIVFWYLNSQENKEAVNEEQYISRIKKYYSDLEEYKKKKIQYSQSLRNYRITKARISDDENFKTKLLKEKQLEYIQTARKPRPQSDKINEGVTESYFKKTFKDYFGSIAFSNLILPNDQERPFYPDFTYWDKEKNLLIDIEIDEPYIGKDGIPIHFSDIDNFRDSIFLENRWLVVRFTERQAVKFPDQCCHAIQDLIENIFDKNKIDDLDIDYLPQEKKWTKDEAHKMAFQRYRNSYLPKDLQMKIEEEKITSSSTVKDDEYLDDLDDSLPF